MKITNQLRQSSRNPLKYISEIERLAQTINSLCSYVSKIIERQLLQSSTLLLYVTARHSKLRNIQFLFARA